MPAWFCPWKAFGPGSETESLFKRYGVTSDLGSLWFGIIPKVLSILWFTDVVNVTYMRMPRSQTSVMGDFLDLGLPTFLDVFGCI